MEEVERRELQLLCDNDQTDVKKPLITAKNQIERSPLDLSLSMSIVAPRLIPNNEDRSSSTKSGQVRNEDVAEQIRLAALERAYADRMRKLASRELELAEKEFARARLIWKRAREEVEKVENMKMIATRRISSTCIEITCRNCRRHFQP